VSEQTLTVDEDSIQTVITDADPEAPFGRFKNGKPRKNPPKGVSAPRAKSPYKSKTKTDYRPGFLGLAQLGAFAASFISPLDAVAVTDHAPRIAEAVQVTADNDPKFAAAMDRILSAGPYAALISATVPMVIQMMHNHMPDRIPGEVVKGMGGRSREEVTQELMAQAA
jgi:hypothetical protein